MTQQEVTNCTVIDLVQTLRYYMVSGLKNRLTVKCQDLKD